MSTDRARRLTPLVALAAGCGFAAPAEAAEVIFRPVIVLSIWHDGNVQIIGESEEFGDEAATVAADLDLSSKTGTSSWELNYRPVYTAYRQNDHLDYFGQSAHFGYTKAFSDRSSLDFDTAASRTDRQGVRPFRPEDPVSFVERNTETRADARIGGTFSIGRRNSIDYGVSGGITRFELEDLDDSSTFGGSGGWRFSFSERASLGFALRGDVYLYDSERAFDPELPPPAVDTGAMSVHIAGQYAFGRTSWLQYSAGATYTDSDLRTDTNFSGNVAYTRNVTEFSELIAGVRQSVGAGTGLGGASLDTGLYVSYTLRSERRGLEANVLTGLWRRDGEAINGPGAGSTTAWSSVESVGWAFNRFISLNAIHTYTDQSADVSEPDVFDTSHHSYGMYVRWNIRGR